MEGKDVSETLTIDEFREALQRIGSPVVTAADVAAVLEADQDAVDAALRELEGEGAVGRRDVPADPRVWYPQEWEDRLSRERTIVFPDRRELVVDQPGQFTRAQLSQFAHLVAASGDGSYLYRIRPVDIWHAPYEAFADLTRTIRAVVGEPPAALMEWIDEQWRRSRQFRLETHEDGYTVLVAATPSLMANVARQELEEGQLRAAISETESWVAEDAIATVKRVLHDAGFPVIDERDLERGDPLELALEVELRDYQREWIDRFMERGAGVLVGPPGSGKTVAALGVMARVGGETLILVPSRELAEQWRERILADTDLGPEQVGEYHGGTKQRRPVTIATYHTAGMDRHRTLFDSREWGLLVADECHRVPAPVFKRTTELQSRHRLGLSSSPVRGDDKEDEIFTLIGPPIGTDWAALIEAGFVIEPELEIRYLPWGSEEARASYAAAEGHELRQVAAGNPAKIEDIRRIRARHEDEQVLIFVDWLDQGRELADALDVPFVSGETPHSEREGYFGAFRDGELATLIVSRVGDEGIDLPDASIAIIASGLGGSRRQGTQRAGRTMRPAGNAKVYVLATRGTREEDFAQHQLRHLEGKGIEVSETTVELEEAPS